MDVVFVGDGVVLYLLAGAGLFLLCVVVFEVLLREGGGGRLGDAGGDLIG